MRFNTVNGGKPERIAGSCKNADTAIVQIGQPLVLAYNGTEDGFAVILPSSGAAQKNEGLKFGVALHQMQVGEVNEALIFGFTPSLMLIRQTRADSTQIWASEPARSVGEYLTVDTAHNGFITTASTLKIVTNATTDTLALQILNPAAVLGQTLASYSSSASATSDTRTAITAAVKASVRMM